MRFLLALSASTICVQAASANDLYNWRVEQEVRSQYDQSIINQLPPEALNYTCTARTFADDGASEMIFRVDSENYDQYEIRWYFDGWPYNDQIDPFLGDFVVKIDDEGWVLTVDFPQTRSGNALAIFTISDLGLETSPLFKSMTQGKVVSVKSTLGTRFFSLKGIDAAWQQLQDCKSNMPIAE